MAIYFQCYAFHGASTYSTFYETLNRDDYIEQFNGITWDPVFSQFWKEISACAAVHIHYVMDGCDHV